MDTPTVLSWILITTGALLLLQHEKVLPADLWINLVRQISWQLLSPRQLIYDMILSHDLTVSMMAEGGRNTLQPAPVHKTALLNYLRSHLLQ